MDLIVESDPQVQIQISAEVEMIKERYEGFTEESCPWISQRREAGDVVSVRAFRHVLCGTLTSRRARRTVTRILRDSSIMSHVYIADKEEENH